MSNIMQRVLTIMNIAFILLIVLFACGCQPTPEKGAIVYGGDLQEKIASSSASIGIYNAPESWQETLDMKGNNIKIEINASISIPDVTAFPVYKVKQAKFENARIETLVNYFAIGRDIMKYTEPTKAELEEQVILARKNNDEEAAAEFEKMIATAPETAEAEKITYWDAASSPAGSFLTENGEYAGISASTEAFGYTNGYIETESVALLNNKDKIGEVAISDEDSIAAAQNMLHELGIDYMVADTLEKAQRYARLTNSTLPQYSEKPVSKGYLIKFTRSIDGIAAMIADGVGFNFMDEFDYRAPLYPEEIQIYVDDLGNVQSFVWSKPLEIEGKVTENVSLLPFEDIKQRISDMLTFINSYDSKSAMVTSIKMNMTIIDVKDHPEEAMYVPAWFIYYTETIEDMPQEYTLALNAIDGGRVLELPADISPDIQNQIDEDLGNNY